MLEFKTMDHKVVFPQELMRSVSEAVGSVYHAPQAALNDESLYGLDGILSSIYFKGDVLGKLSVFIRGMSAALIVASMVSEDELAEDSAEVLDGIGEIVNITAGCLKKHLEPHKLIMDISVPSTRFTSIIPPGRWENVIEQVYTARDVSFKVIFSYRIPTREEKTAAPLQTPQVKLKLSAAELLKQVLARKK